MLNFEDYLVDLLHEHQYLTTPIICTVGVVIYIYKYIIFCQYITIVIYHYMY